MAGPFDFAHGGASHRPTKVDRSNPEFLQKPSFLLSRMGVLGIFCTMEIFLERHRRFRGQKWRFRPFAQGGIAQILYFVNFFYSFARTNLPKWRPRMSAEFSNQMRKFVPSMEGRIRCASCALRE